MSLGSQLSRDGAGLLPYQERVIAERDELYKDFTKLGSFIRSNTFKELPGIDKRLLVAQKSAMETYLDILEIRIKLFHA